MRNATGHAPRGKWAAVKKMVNRNTYISSMKRVSGKFLEVSRCSRAKQRQRNVQKSVLYVQSCILLDLFFISLVVFTFSLLLHDFMFCLSKLLIGRDSLLAPAKSISLHDTSQFRV